MKQHASWLWWIGSALILGLGGYLLAVALAKGEPIMAFILCPMALIGVLPSVRLSGLPAHQPPGSGLSRGTGTGL